MNFSAKILGVSQINRALAALPTAMRNKALRPALREGAKVVKNQSVANLRALLSGESSGTLEKSLTVKMLRQRNKVLRVAVVIANRLTPDGIRAGLAGSIFELGDNKDQPPRSYMRTGLRQSQQRAMGVVFFNARKRLNAAVIAARKG